MASNAGRPPKPTALKLLQGTARPDRVNPNEPQPKKAAKVPSPPPELSVRGKKTWRKMAKELHGLGLLTNVDLHALQNYCQCHDEMITAQALLIDYNIKNPTTPNLTISNSGMMRSHPYVNQIKEARAQMLKFAQEFGLTPSARTRVSAPEKPKDDDGWGQF